MAPFQEFQVNFIVAVLIGLLSFLWAVLSRVVRQYHFQRKHRVGGTYLSYFEDVQDGKRVWVKAPLRVRQRGDDLKVKGKDLLKGRNTDTRAKISPNGSIVGTYGRLNPNDPAKGVVFLEPDPVSVGLYRGFYAGYDSTLRRLVSGRYVWRKMLEPRIAPVTASMSEARDCRAMLGDYLSSHYATEDMLDGAFAGNQAAIMLGAWVDDVLIGALLLDTDTTLDLSIVQRQSAEAEQPSSIQLHRTGSISAVTVAADHRGRGVATMLINAAVDQLRELNCTAVVATVWRRHRPEDDDAILDDVFTDHAPSGVDWADAAPAAESEIRLAPGDLAGRLIRTEGFRLIGRYKDNAMASGGCQECGDAGICRGWLYMKGLTRDTAHARLSTTKASTG